MVVPRAFLCKGIFLTSSLTLLLRHIPGIWWDSDQLCMSVGRDSEWSSDSSVSWAWALTQSRLPPSSSVLGLIPSCEGWESPDGSSSHGHAWAVVTTVACVCPLWLCRLGVVGGPEACVQSCVASVLEYPWFDATALIPWFWVSCWAGW